MKSVIADLSQDGLIVDLFAGGGGASVGIEAATGRSPDIAINHNKVALAVHRKNHPKTKHLVTDVWEVDPLKATKGRRVSLLWASPDCRHFSKAKGGKPVKRKIRSLAWVVIKWAKLTRPDMIFLENVEEFRDWGPLGRDSKPIKKRKGEIFRRWIRNLELHGYAVEHRILDASHYGAPTKRKRLFIIARRDGQKIRWPEQTHGADNLFLKPYRTAAECIDWSIPCPSIFLTKKQGRKLGVKRPLAKKTMWRIAQGLKKYVLNNPRPFIVKVNHGGMEDRSESIDRPLSTVTASRRGHAVVAPVLQQSGYGERKGQAARVLNLHEPLGTVVAGGPKHALVAAGAGLDEPMRTVTTKDRFGLVVIKGTVYEIVDIGMRMLEPHELLRAQFGRFAERYDLSDAKTKTGKVRLIGNSVSPENAEAVIACNWTPREQLRQAA